VYNYCTYVLLYELRKELERNETERNGMEKGGIGWRAHCFASIAHCMMNEKRKGKAKQEES